MEFRTCSTRTTSSSSILVQVRSPFLNPLAEFALKNSLRKPLRHRPTRLGPSCLPHRHPPRADHQRGVHRVAHDPLEAKARDALYWDRAELGGGARGWEGGAQYAAGRESGRLEHYECSLLGRGGMVLIWIG